MESQTEYKKLVEDDVFEMVASQLMEVEKEADVVEDKTDEELVGDIPPLEDITDEEPEDEIVLFDATMARSMLDGKEAMARALQSQLAALLFKQEQAKLRKAQTAVELGLLEVKGIGGCSWPPYQAGLSQRNQAINWCLDLVKKPNVADRFGYFLRTTSKAFISDLFLQPSAAFAVTLTSKNAADKQNAATRFDMSNMLFVVVNSDVVVHFLYNPDYRDHPVLGSAYSVAEFKEEIESTSKSDTSDFEPEDEAGNSNSPVAVDIKDEDQAGGDSEQKAVLPTMTQPPEKWEGIKEWLGYPSKWTWVEKPTCLIITDDRGLQLTWVNHNLWGVTVDTAVLTK